MPSEEDIQKALKDQAHRIHADEDLSPSDHFESAKPNTEEELTLAKQEQERILKYTPDTAD